MKLCFFTILLVCTFSIAPAAERVAFVAGNCAYTTLAKLDNPKQDAAEVSRALGDLGFAVTRVDDATVEGLKTQFSAFCAAHPDAREMVVYFSGHGLQVHGENYLTGTDSTIFDAVKRGTELEALLKEASDRTEQLEKETRRDARRSMWALSDLTTTLGKSGQKSAVRVVILDSCRDNPAGTKSALPSKGLAKVEAPSGMLIAFAAKEGTTAAQTEAGKTSLYTQSLLKFITQPGLTAEQVFKKTRAAVIEASGGAQEPREYSGLTGELVFQPGGGAAEAAKLMPAETPQPEAAQATKTTATSKDARRDQPFLSTAGLKFIPIPNTRVLGSLYETTRADFSLFVKETGYSAVGEGESTLDSESQHTDNWRNPGFEQADTHPVVAVSEADALAFCRWLTARDRKSGRIGPGDYYALPTDDEWFAMLGEKSCPWGEGTTPPANSGNLCGTECPNDVDNIISGYRDGFVYTAPVGKFSPTKFGFYDVAGNAAELISSDTEEGRMVFSSDAGEAFKAREMALMDGVPYVYTRGGSFAGDGTWSGGGDRMKAFVGSGDTGFRCVLIHGVPANAPIPDYFGEDDVTPEKGSYMAAKNGAKVWNNSPRYDDVAEWTGKVDAGGFATHYGTLKWYKGNQFFVSYEGYMVRGRFEGKTIARDYDGTKEERFWVNGEKQSK